MVMTRSKRTKRVLRWLSSVQDEDEFLGPSSTPLIRYTLLYNYNRCVQVTITLAEATTVLHNSVPFTKLPNFLKSQLDAQKIADGTRLWKQIAPILTFIHANLRPIGASRGFPTLFLWHSSEHHRSYFFFAYLDTKMAPLTYTARELMRMRPLPPRKELYDELYNKLHKDLALGEILRLPADRSLPLIEEESSSGDEQDGVIDPDPTLVRQLDGTDCEWKYKGRSEEECSETQPIPAPTGLSAQKDEGFQRFYKAVVSPTHVRVTAGGRIVPNTRASSSPTAKWSKDRLSSDTTFSVRATNRDPPDPSMFSHAQPPVAGFHPMYAGYSPAMMPAAMGGPAAFPFFPWHMYNTFGVPVGISQVPEKITTQKDEPKGHRDGIEEQTQTPNPGTLPSPGQFGPSRPFFFNGQWAMPGSQAFMPYGMPSVPNAPHAPLLGQTMFQQRHPGPASASPQKSKVDKSSDSQGQMASQPSTASNTSTTGHATAPISSIRPSEITKKQIDVLRGSLKYLEDQLQYNKHQIDEKWMEYQAQMVRQQIQQFEKNLDSQRSFEETHYPRRREGTSESLSSFSGPQSGVSTKSDAAPAQTSQMMYKTDSFRSRTKSKNENDRTAPRFGSGINSTKSVFAFAPMRIHEEPVGDEKTSKKTSSLPVNAALAKPFQPQVDSTGALADPVNYSGSPIPMGGQFATTFSLLQLNSPYLVGTLPPGVNAEQARDVDYVYARELTEDELRARHMYWGKAPHHLQRGLPKFDGKDFYPPSPVRDRSSDFVSSHNQFGSVGDVDTQSSGNSEKPVYDPFRSLGRPRQRMPRQSLGKCTQSETLPRPTSSIRSNGSSIAERPAASSANLSGRSYNDFRAALESSIVAESASSKTVSSSDDGEDDKSLLFKGRKAPVRVGTKSRNDIWQSVLRKGKSSGSALPGTISSTTARGVLPQYKGHASAYLAPTIANSAIPLKQQSSKHAENVEVVPVNPATALQGKNLPPSGNTDTASDTAANFATCHHPSIMST